MIKLRLLWSAIVLLSSLVLAACGGESAPTAAPTAPPAQGGGSVEIVSSTFTPKEISLPVGASITWTSKDSLPHTVTASDNSFDSGTLNNGGTFQQTLSKAGTITYYCKFHGTPDGGGMAATIKVG